jgi:hypothetical protein
MAPSYICAMRQRKSQRERRVTTWQICRLRRTPAAFVGLVDAPDAASAKGRAIKQFGGRPERLRPAHSGPALRPSPGPFLQGALVVWHFRHGR